MQLYYLKKRIFDILFSISILVVLSPILLIISIFIALDSEGPIIYTSLRVGKNRKVFRFYKFRTMLLGSDLEVRKYIELNRYRDRFIKLKNDPRITGIGKFLRKYSLDELPQLFNVIRGDMSIVGNRPLPVYEAKLIESKFEDRFKSEAGITGLWQVERNTKDVDSDGRLQYDIYYAKNRSFATDTKILFRTFKAIRQESEA